MVLPYGPDYYATRPLEKSPDYTRDYRTNIDNSATHPEWYFYGSALWRRSFDMWNEPVLMFRTDAVYDRGTEYSTRTLGGHNLTLVAEIEEFVNFANEDELADSQTTAYAYKTANGRDWAGGELYLDGTKYTIPTWREAWKK